MVSPPGSVAEKFIFTIWDENAAQQVSSDIGKRVSFVLRTAHRVA